MNIILQPTQIPQYWEVIKHAAVNTIGIEEHKRHSFFVTLLCKLYSNKLQCMLTLNSDRLITSIWVIEILKDLYCDEKHGVIHALYGYAKRDLSEHQESAEAILKIFRNEGCTKIYFETGHETILNIAKAFNAECTSKKYMVNI